MVVAQRSGRAHASLQRGHGFESRRVQWLFSLLYLFSSFIHVLQRFSQKNCLAMQLEAKQALCVWIVPQKIH